MCCIYNENAGYGYLDWLQKDGIQDDAWMEGTGNVFPSDALFLYTQYRVFFMIQSNIRYFILAKNYRGGVYWA